MMRRRLTTGLAEVTVALLFLVSPLLAAGTTVVMTLALIRPTFLVAFAATSSLVHPGSAAAVVRLPQYQTMALLVVGSLAIVMRNRDRRTLPDARPLLWSLGVGLGLLAVRLILDGNEDAGVSVLIGLGAASTLLVMDGAQRGRLALDLGIIGVVYAFATVGIGEAATNEARFAGLAGNPNRMSFALLTLLPFVVALPSAGRLLAVPAAFATIVALSRSGSAQAAAVLVVMALAFLTSNRALTTWPRRIAATAAGLAAILPIWAELNDKLFAASDDLSGRTSFFRAAVDGFRSSPLIGTGSLRVTIQDSFSDNSAHNTYLSILAAAGLLCAVPLLVFLVRVLRRLPRGMRAGDAFAYAAIAVMLSALVQSVELIPLTWLVLAAAGTSLERTTAPPVPRVAHAV
jgi:hypothetical protein